MATSSVNSGGTPNTSSKKTKTAMPAVANEMVTFFKDLIIEVVKGVAPRVHTAEVVGVEEENGDKRYDLRIVSDPDSTIIHGIVNNTRYDLKIGDYVDILDTQNDLSVSYIINKYHAPFSSGGAPERDSKENDANIDNKLKVHDEVGSGYSYLETSDGKFFLVQDTVNNVTASVLHGTILGSSSWSGTIVMGTPLTLTIVPSAGYVLPTTVTVSGGNYTYDSSTGTLELNSVGNDMVVSIECPTTITGNITNGSLTGDTTIIETGTAQVHIVPNTGYTFPADSGSISVTNASIVAYNSGTGVLSISNPSGPVVVTTICPVASAGYNLTATVSIEESLYSSRVMFTINGSVDPNDSYDAWARGGSHLFDPYIPCFITYGPTYIDTPMTLSNVSTIALYADDYIQGVLYNGDDITSDVINATEDNPYVIILSRDSTISFAVTHD